MIKQLAHICIHTTDLAETEKFYCDTLGLARGFDFVKDGRVFGFYLKLSERTFIEVFEGESGKVGNINHLAIEVEEMDRVIAALQENGYTTTEKIMGADHSWQAWTEDPSGVRIEFHEYTEKSMQLKGGVCVIE